MTASNPRTSVLPSPAVTVGMPVYNCERFVGEAVESVLAQTFTDFDLLISDDASTDRTAAICAEFAARDARIRLVRQSVNLGPFLNLKYVTDSALAPLLVWLAQDDAIHPHYLQECIEQMGSNDRNVLVTSDFRIIDESGRQICIESLESIRASVPWQVRRAEFFRFPVYSNIFYAFYGMMKTEAGRAMFSQLRRPKYMSQIELPVLARLATLGEISSFPRILRDYRRVSTSLFHTELKSLLSRSTLSQIRILVGHFGRLMADQVSVLVRSSLSVKAKAGILLHLIYYYCVKCVVILARGKAHPR